ncbi:conserved exported hypothetical protein [Tenacibaculum maritimum]|uniref:alpha-2-macroglobulin family protein n=1 Tax=Tenacibaculum maritimum TaxID=107401 RepID=UPI0012E4BAB5|nr:MG2 domain-containing protein [Tenacibaculum maritimum]CAA0170549.1 conserved exported hypothetical protein [Tenacibaculum maritimum]
MRKLTTVLLMIFLFSTTIKAQESYQSLWNKVAQYEADNLPKSALKEVNSIYKKAEKEQNSPQIIKSLFYKSKFSLRLQENAQLKIINEFKQQISKSTTPTKNVLENILANLYWQYFSQHKWQFYNRTQTTKPIDKNDFRTWDLNTLFQEIHKHYQASLANGLILQQTDVREFSEILHTANTSKIYRPTLFDFLAHNALDFYKTNEINITKPSYQFKIKNTELINEAKLFASTTLKTKDTLSLSFNALKIYQELILFHLKDKTPEALVDVDIKRLNFVKQHATFNRKKERYLQTLQTSKEHYKSNAVSGLYAFEIANTYYQQANKYVPNQNEEHRFKNQKALALCHEINSDFPKSDAAQKCERLAYQIRLKSLQITAEKFLPIHQYSRVLINYKNIHKLFFSIYNITPSQLATFKKIYDKKERILFIKKLKKTNSWESNLKNEEDYQLHRTEISIPKLAQGSYLFIASSEKNITPEATIGTTDIQATNLVFITNTERHQNKYQIVDRNTGKPIPQAKVIFSNKPYQRYGDRIHKAFTTDKNGAFKFTPHKKHYGNVNAIVHHKGDHAIFGKFYISEQYFTPKEATKTYINSFLFTDRSIYRPGQTIHFKGIAMEKTKENTQVKPNRKGTIILKDANAQVVKKQVFTTNEFGSFSGSFILPNTGITGIFSMQTIIDDHTDSTTISVEEYKRPKFEAHFAPIKKSYALNEDITVHGNATSFSGANITAAKVAYRVHRKVVFPRWWYSYRPAFVSNSQEIAHGESVTDTSGNFTIKFKAIPDESIAPESMPIFTYEVTADLTDLNGETSSTTTYINVGYHSLIADISMEDTIHKDVHKQVINIHTKNVSGIFTPAKGTIQIYKLVPPKKIVRKRPWNAPDYQEIPEGEFHKKFPHDTYKNDGNPKHWKKGKLTLSLPFNTEKSSEIKLKGFKKWPSGKYIVELESTDKQGNKIKNKHFFELFSTKDKLPSDNQLFSVRTNKETYNSNDTALVTFSSHSKDITIMVSVEKKHQIVDQYYIHLNKSSKTIEIPITPNDKGGFAVNWSFVNYNSFQKGSLLIKVPYPKTALEIDIATFRDKLQPGQHQTWSFTVKGTKKDKVLAELLAGMYDASLDQFKSNDWNFSPIDTPIYTTFNHTEDRYSFQNTSFSIQNLNTSFSNNYQTKNYDRWNWFGFYFQKRREMMLRGAAMGAPRTMNMRGTQKELIMQEEAVNNYDSNTLATVPPTNTSKKDQKTTPSKGIHIRKNLQETAFFYPHLVTDKDGNITFNFTAPEALTRWKLQLLAHTKELHSAVKTLETVTQKELMVIPNAPRFLREGDTISFSTKISNLSSNELQGTAQLILTDAITGKVVDLCNNSKKTSNQPFIVDAKGNTNISWRLSIPKHLQAIQYKVIAKSGSFSDGEQHILPILSNSTLVTETLPLWVHGNSSKTFILEKLKANRSASLKNHQLTLEITSNPAWYAIQALPYLMEYPYDCSEQTFAKYYANSLASHIANSNPKIQEVFQQWKSSNALLSNLEKNQALKSLLIQETPWIRDAQSETEQKKRIALLLDINHMSNQQQRSLHKLQNMQMSNGGFPWFKNGRYPSKFITNHIASGFGHLKHLGVTPPHKSTAIMVHKAVHFLDLEIANEYKKLLELAAQKHANDKKRSDFLNQNHLSHFALQYLYMRSFYTNLTIPSNTKKAIDYYKKQATMYWQKQTLLGQGLIALVQFRIGNRTIAHKIIRALKENSISSEELGMYWKSNQPSWHSYQAPIETQSLLIEAFSEIENDLTTIDRLKTWLLKKKQVNRWQTTKATTEAIYALLLNGSKWLAIDHTVTVHVGNTTVLSSNTMNKPMEAGTGYFKTSWNSDEITPKMSTINITNKNEGIAWGAMYWQYFEDLDNITAAETPLKLSKKLFLKRNTGTGKELKDITSKTRLKVGDLITVRIVLRSDRDMEFIHMKDMRASGLEPIQTLSKHQWQDGLYYYQSTKDATTNFFFDRLPKGVYVFEYDLRVNNSGNFSNGITTIQSMYAPEFSSHSKGNRILVD